MLVGFILFGFLGYFLMPKLYSASKSSYSRKGIEGVTEKLLGHVNITDALTEEVVIIAYDYNSHEPRIFSKFAARNDPKTYGLEIK